MTSVRVVPPPAKPRGNKSVFIQTVITCQGGLKSLAQCALSAAEVKTFHGTTLTRETH